jgi:hypothetical protein
LTDFFANTFKTETMGGGGAARNESFWYDAFENLKKRRSF